MALGNVLRKEKCIKFFDKTVKRVFLIFIEKLGYNVFTK